MLLHGAFFVEYFWAPMCILSNIDLVYKLCQICNPFVLTDIYTKNSLALIRFIAIQRMCTKGRRLILTIVIPYLTILKTYIDILILLRSTQLTKQTIFLYNQLHCMNNTVIDI